MKIRLMVIAALLLLPVIIYYADWLLDDNHVDCFDNKVNHVLIFCGAMILVAIAIICFILFYKFNNDKYEKK